MKLPEFESLPSDPFDETEGWLELNSAEEAEKALLRVPQGVMEKEHFRYLTKKCQLAVLKKDWPAAQAVAEIMTTSYPMKQLGWHYLMFTLTLQSKFQEAEEARERGADRLYHLVDLFLRLNRPRIARECLVGFLALKPWMESAILDVPILKKLLEDPPKGSDAARQGPQDS